MNTHGFITLNSGEGHESYYRVSDIVSIEPRYAGRWMDNLHMAGSCVHLRNGKKFKVIETPLQIIAKIQEQSTL